MDAKQLDMAALDAFRAHLAAHALEAHAAGVGVEDKGYSVALHYRLAPDRVAAQRCIEALLRDLDPRLHFFGGKCVVNVVVAGAPDKGDALASLVARSGADSALFVGDDLNDEAVFMRAEPTWLTVRIGRDDPMSKADFFLDNHAEVITLLQLLLEVLSAA